MIAEGKLAVIKGIEVSEPFGCRVYNDQPQCDRAKIDRELDEVYGFGVRQMELINKFDNALGGVAGDSGNTGVVVNGGNLLATGHFWRMQHCTGPPDEHDKQQPGVYDHDEKDMLSNVIEQFLPSGVGAGVPERLELQRDRADRSRRPRGPPPDAEEDDHRPRPPERACAQERDGPARGAALLGRRVEPQLEQRRRDPAHLQARRRGHADEGVG